MPFYEHIALRLSWLPHCLKQKSASIFSCRRATVSEALSIRLLVHHPSVGWSVTLKLKRRKTTSRHRLRYRQRREACCRRVSLNLHRLWRSATAQQLDYYCNKWSFIHPECLQIQATTKQLKLTLLRGLGKEKYRAFSCASLTYRRSFVHNRVLRDNTRLCLPIKCSAWSLGCSVCHTLFLQCLASASAPMLEWPVVQPLPTRTWLGYFLSHGNQIRGTMWWTWSCSLSVCLCKTFYLLNQTSEVHETLPVLFLCQWELMYQFSEKFINFYYPVPIIFVVIFY